MSRRQSSESFFLILVSWAIIVFVFFNLLGCLGLIILFSSVSTPDADAFKPLLFPIVWGTVVLTFAGAMSVVVLRLFAFAFEALLDVRDSLRGVLVVRQFKQPASDGAPVISPPSALPAIPSSPPLGGADFSFLQR
jgi:hypothetical protein